MLDETMSGESKALKVINKKMVNFKEWSAMHCHSFLPPKIRGEMGGGVLVFKIRTKRGVMKILLRDRGLVERR